MLGHEARSTASTDANIDSSRSHAVLQICLQRQGQRPGFGGKITFIDLAGSERAADTGKTVEKTRRLEVCFVCM